MDIYLQIFLYSIIFFLIFIIVYCNYIICKKVYNRKNNFIEINNFKVNDYNDEEKDVDTFFL